MEEQEGTGQAEGTEGQAQPPGSTVDEALSQIPGLSESMEDQSAARSGAGSVVAEADAEAAPPPPPTPPPAPEGGDSDTVQSALDEIPGLRDSLGQG